MSDQLIRGEGPGPSPLAADQITSPSEGAGNASPSAPERAPDLLYLVAHKCRGEMVWEIALRWEFGTQSDPAPWFILQSTGNRVYPCWVHSIFEPPSICPEVAENFEKERDFWEPRAEPVRFSQKARATSRAKPTIDDVL